MAPLAGLLIEYFVVGAVASIWLAPFLLGAILAQSSLINLPKEVIPVAAAAFVPALYLVGMICDLLGYKLLHERKTEFEDRVRSEAKLGKFSAQRVHALAIENSRDLAKELETRSTRDRIARGSLIASIPMLWFSPFDHFGPSISTTIAVVVVVTLYQLWYRMQTLSAKYEVQVVRILQEKYNVNVSGKSEEDAPLPCLPTTERCKVCRPMAEPATAVPSPDAPEPEDKSKTAGSGQDHL